MSYLDIGALIFTEIIGDFGFKKFANAGGLYNFSVGSIGYIGVIYFLIRSLQGSQLLVVNAVWDGMSALFESLAVFIFLGERLDDPYKYLGIILIIIGLFFVRMPIVSPHEFTFPKF